MSPPPANALKCIQCYSERSETCLNNNYNVVECPNATKSCMTGFVTDYSVWYKRGGSRINNMPFIRGRRKLLEVPIYRSVKRCYNEVDYKDKKESCKSNRFNGYKVVVCLCNSDLCNSNVLSRASTFFNSTIFTIILSFLQI